MRFCLLFVLICVPCYAEKIASNFKEAEYLALKNESFLKYKVIKKSIMNENNLSILEWCIKKNDAWSGTSFDLIFELNYQGEITRSFKSVESPVADCFILNIKKKDYPEPKNHRYYIATPIIMFDGSMSGGYDHVETELDLKSLGIKSHVNSSYSQSQEKWLRDNALK